MRVPNASRIAFEALRQVKVLRTTPCRVRRRCSGRVQVSHAGRVSHGARRGAGWLGQCQDGRCGSAVTFDPIEREHPQPVMRVLKWQEVPPEVGTHARKRRVAKASASMRVVRDTLSRRRAMHLDDALVSMFPWAHGHQHKDTRDFVHALMGRQTGCQAQLARSFGHQEAATTRSGSPLWYVAPDLCAG